MPVVQSIAEQRRALAPWFVQARADLDRHDWTAAFATYPRLDLREEPAPWAGVPRDLRAARVTLIGSAGLTTPDQPAYDYTNPDGDYSWRPLPATLDLTTTRVSREHYDNASALRDRNSVYPLDRLHDLVAAGELGGLTPTQFSLMGYQPDWGRLLDEVVPSLVAAIAEQQPDAALLVPV